MAKGIFTQIKYNAQGVMLREAAVTGLIVGIPITTEQKSKVIPNEEDVTLGDSESNYISEIEFDLNNPGVNHRDGDVIQEMRVWIRGLGEKESQYHEIKDADLTESNGVYTVVPVKRLTADKAEWVQESGTLTFNSTVEDIGPGYTIKIGSDYGMIESPIGQSIEGHTTCSVKWATSVSADISSASVDVYYDYVCNPYNGMPRGYALNIDKVAFRPSIYGVHTVNSMDDLTVMFGMNSLDNPKSNLAMGAFLYGAAAGWGNKFKICALDLRAKAADGSLETATTDDIMSDMASWASVFSNHVDPHKDVYYIAPMTASDSVHDSAISYVRQASRIENQSEKRLYVSKKIAGVVDDVSQDLLDANFGNAKYGDMDYAPGRMYRDGYVDDDTVKYIDKDSDVETAMSVPMPVNSERVTFIGCEYATIENTNIEGYYVSAIIAGWRSSLEIGYDTSDMKVPLLTSIASGLSFYSGKDFNDLAQAGWYMLSQDKVGAPVTCYIQRTTGYDSVERSEESFIVALDHCMRDIRETIAPYTRGGLYNRISADNPDSPRTVSYLNRLNAGISIVRYKYIDMLEAFAAMDIISVRASKMKKTGAEVDVKINHYYPVREIIVTAYVE